MQDKHQPKARQQPNAPLNYAHEQILNWLQNVKFRKQMFGGISERDLWKKLDELNDLCESAISAERARYDALLQAQQKSADSTIAKYKTELAESRTKYSSLVKLVQKMQKEQKIGDTNAETR